MLYQVPRQPVRGVHGQRRLRATPRPVLWRAPGGGVQLRTPPAPLNQGQQPTRQTDKEEMRASCSERVILDLGILGYRPQKDRVSHPERTRAGFGA